jgi:predicted DNA-binding antitoxin AbrB/MazE fold protein
LVGATGFEPATSCAQDGGIGALLVFASSPSSMRWRSTVYSQKGACSRYRSCKRPRNSIACNTSLAFNFELHVGGSQPCQTAAGLEVQLGMALQVDAVYENGVLRPLQPLDLEEHERVVVSVEKTSPEADGLDVEYINQIRRELGDEPPPGLEEVRRRLSKIPGSMAEVIIAERGDR